MKAIRVNSLGGPEVLQIEDLPVPEPFTDQVLIRIRAIGVNPVDTYIRAGYQGYDPVVPYTPGFDAAGIIEKTGKAVTPTLRAGQRVYLAGSLTGTYAEYALCTPDQVHPLPDHTSFAQGAAVYVAYTTAYRSLIQRAAARPGETVLIHGASGAVGIAAIQFARQLGMKIIATASSNEGQLLAVEQGADQVFDHTDKDHFSLIRDFSSGAGVDIILEMMAQLNLADDLKILAHGGRVVVIGSRGMIAITPRDTMACDGAILGMSLMNINEHDQQEAQAAIGAGLRNQSLAPVIRCELPLSEAATAHEQVMQSGASGKIILIP